MFHQITKVIFAMSSIGCIMSASIVAKDETLVLHLDDDRNTTNNVSINKIIDLAIKNLNEKEDVCRGGREILHKNVCRTLGYPSRDLCKQNEVYLLEKPSGGVANKRELSLKIVCKQRRCGFRDNVYWWPQLQRCVTDEEANTLCGQHSRLLDDVFGEGMCQCFDTYGQLNEGGKCFQYYQQGPCEKGQVLIHDAKSSFGRCVLDLCYTSNERAYEAGGLPTKRESKMTSYGNVMVIPVDVYEVSEYRQLMENKTNKFAPLNGDGECLELGSSKDCDSYRNQGSNSTWIFAIDSSTNVPTCIETNDFVDELVEDENF